MNNPDLTLEAHDAPEAPRAPRQATLPLLRRLRPVLIGFTVLVFLALAWPGAQPPGMDNDSESYLMWPKPWISGGVEMMLRRAPVYPILLKIIPRNQLPNVQAAVSVAAWCTLGYAIFGYLGLVFMGLFCLSYEVHQFNYLMWTESPALSFTWLALAFGIFLVRRWSWPRYAAWAAWLTLMALIRDTNLYLLPFFAFPALWQWRRKPRLAAILGLAAFLFIAGTIDHRINKRWRFPCTVAIIDRVLPDPAAVDFFTRRGMPYNDGIAQMAHKIWRSEQVPFRAQYPEFFEWINKYGMGTYQRWVLSRPDSYKVFFKNISYLVSMPFDYPALDKAYRIEKLPWFVERFRHHWLYNFVPPLKYWLALFLLPLIDFILNRRLHHLTVILFILLLCTYANAFISYHGDGMEIERHSYTAAMLYRITSFMGPACLFAIMKQKFYPPKKEAQSLKIL